MSEGEWAETHHCSVSEHGIVADGGEKFKALRESTLTDMLKMRGTRKFKTHTHTHTRTHTHTHDTHTTTHTLNKQKHTHTPTQLSLLAQYCCTTEHAYGLITCPLRMVINSDSNQHQWLLYTVQWQIMTFLYEHPLLQWTSTDTDSATGINVFSLWTYLKCWS